MGEKTLFRKKFFTALFALIIIALLAYGISSCNSLVNYFQLKTQIAADYAAAVEAMSVTADEAADFVYIVDNGEITITGYKGSDAHVTIPSKIDNVIVSAIGKAAFANTINLNTVTLPVTVTTISEQAFYDCSFLQEIEMPSGLLMIEEYAFEGCTGLIKADLPPTLTQLGDYAFYRSGIVNADIPDSCINLGYGIFSNCYDLKSARLPSNCTNISDKTFYHCSSLEKLILPDNLESIGSQAFLGCVDLDTITIPKNVRSIAADAFVDCSITVYAQNEPLSYNRSGYTSYKGVDEWIAEK